MNVEKEKKVAKLESLVACNDEKDRATVTTLLLFEDGQKDRERLYPKQSKAKRKVSLLQPTKWHRIIECECKT